MKRMLLPAFVLVALMLASCDSLKVGTGLDSGKKNENQAATRMIDHSDATVEGLTAARIASAKAKLDIAYWHTSHGSQLVTGMDGMDAHYGSEGWFTLNGTDGLSLIEPEWTDLGANSDFAATTRDYLASHTDTNVVLWSWCGQVAGYDEATIAAYLTSMNALEAEYPDVVFVYMTGHSDGSGLEGNLHLRDKQIRDYCVANNKWLFDFYDIECYDPDGNYFGDKYVSDACNYDFNGDQTTEGGESGPAGEDKNWAIDWQTAHPDGWWSCSSAHSQPLNANQKAKAAWQLFVAVAEAI
jgi:hypothetical protein